MKNALILASVLLSTLAASPLFATAKVNFSGSCAGGSFDQAGNDFEYSNLGLDLIDGQTSAECVIDTTLPGKPGFQISLSTFKAEASAFVDAGGVATLFVNHRINGVTAPGARAIAKADGSS